MIAACTKKPVMNMFIFAVKYVVSLINNKI